MVRTNIRNNKKNNRKNTSIGKIVGDDNEIIKSLSNKDNIYANEKHSPTLSQAIAQITPMDITPASVINIPSPNPLISFQGVGDNNTSIPPDVAGAPGGNELGSALNSQYGRQIRDGVSKSIQTITQFWSPVGRSPFDSRIVFEPFNKRWIVTAADSAQSANSALLIAVSRSQELSDVIKFSIKADPTSQSWLDFPILGFTSTLIVVAGNMFSVSNGAFISTNLYVFDKASLYNGTFNPTSNLSRLSIPSSQGAGFCPTLTYDNNISTMYLVQRFNSNFNGLGYIRLASLTGSVSTGININLNLPFITAPPWSSTGPQAPQLGTNITIDNGDDRIQNVIYQGGLLWFTQTVFLPATNPTRSSIQWWCITTTPSIVQRDIIDDPTNATFRAYPSIAANSRQDMLIGYSLFSSRIYPSSAYSYHDHNDPVNTTRTEVLLKSGEAIYAKTFGSGRVRWGDYTSTLPDINDNYTFWTYQEYSSTGPTTYGGNWGTWWGRIQPPVGTIIGKVLSDFTDARRSQIGVYDTSTGIWSIIVNGTVISQKYGTVGDVPISSRSYSAAQSSLMVWRPSANTYYIRPPIGDTSGTDVLVQWGLATDFPICADWNGDGIEDLGVYRNGLWYFTDNLKVKTLSAAWGTAGDIPIVGDWFNIGRKQIGVWRPSNNNFYLLDPITKRSLITSWGSSALGDVPVIGDFLGKGYEQLGIWRSSTGYWYVKDQLTNQTTFFPFGIRGDVPLQGDFDGDGVSDFAVWRRSTATFYIRQSSNGQVVSSVLGNINSIPTTAIYTYRYMRLLSLPII